VILCQKDLEYERTIPQYFLTEVSYSFMNFIARFKSVVGILHAKSLHT